MSEKDPGLMIIGCGFNVYADKADQFDSITNSALKSRVFKVDDSTADRIDCLGKVEDKVYTLMTTSEIKTHFSEQVGVKMRYGAFNGSAHVSYQTQNSSQYSFMCFLREHLHELYGLQIEDNETNIDGSFKEAVRKLPENFDYSKADNKKAFINFFKEYGTHVIMAVGMGLRSRLSRTISRQVGMNAVDVAANVEAEYNFFAKGKSETKYSEEVYNSFAKRERTFIAWGGNKEYAGQAGDDPDIYKKWEGSIGENPAVVQMKLEAMSNIEVVKTLGKQEAIEDALDYFDIRMSALPVYHLQCPEKQDQEEDNLFWTFEDGDRLYEGYDNKGIVFYVLPRQTSPQKPLANVQVYTKPGAKYSWLRPYAYNMWDPIPNKEHPEFTNGWEERSKKDLTILYRDTKNPVKIYADSVELRCYDKSSSSGSPSTQMCYLSISAPPDATRYNKERAYPYGYVFTEAPQDPFSKG